MRQCLSTSHSQSTFIELVPFCSRVISFSVHITSFTTELFQHVPNPHAQVGLKILSMSACLKGFTSTEYRSDLCFAPTCRSFANWISGPIHWVIWWSRFSNFWGIRLCPESVLIYPYFFQMICVMSIHTFHTHYIEFICLAFIKYIILVFQLSLHFKAHNAAITVADTDGNLFYSGTSTEASNLCGYVSGLIHASAYIHCYSLIAGRFAQEQ